MLRDHMMATTQQQYQPPMMSSLGQINQRRIKTKISQTLSTASPLKMLRDHVMTTTQQQHQPPMSSLGQINQKRIKKNKISQTPNTVPTHDITTAPQCTYTQAPSSSNND